MNEITKLHQQISIDTWNRIKFASEVNLKISETTLTENLLYLINQHNINSKNNQISIYESTNEKTNGNDLEIYLEISKNKYIFLAIQAKKLYTKKYKYESISHKVNNIYQINFLLNYAKNQNGLALYLFYNYFPNYNHNNKEYFGCTLFEASAIKKTYYPLSKTQWTIPSFESLHTYNKLNSYCTKSKLSAVPWHFLTNKKYIKKYVDLYNKLNTQSLKEYLYDEIDEDEWIQIDEDTTSSKAKSLHTIGMVESPSCVKTINQFFKPKFRIIINQDN